MKKVLTLFLLMLTAMAGFAQGSPESPQMADAFRADGKIYVVIAVLGLIFVGLAVYLVLIDRKVSKLEKQLQERK